MANRMEGTVQRQFDTLFNVGVIRELTDGQLLERYATGRGESAELAFAVLVERHGPMVLRVCRARLADPDEALDAFQATFLVLIQKSRGLWVRDSLGPWLHQVALRTAACARSASARRGRAERTAAELAVATRLVEEAHDSGWEQALHEEINRLPERYRLVIVLCDLEGCTCEEAARRIGRPVGTVKCWRARGRELLRQRLIRSGLSPSFASALGLEAGLPRAFVPGTETAEAARALSDTFSAGAFPASVRVLVKGVVKAMILSKLKLAGAVICTLAILTIGLTLASRGASDDPAKPPEKLQTEQITRSRDALGPEELSPPKDLGQENWSLSLRDAVRIGLNNADFVDVRLHEAAHGVRWEPALKNSPDRLREANCAIHPSDAKMNPQRFKAQAMALVRSIEQLYWMLSQQYVRLWANERAVDLAQELLNSEQAKPSPGYGPQGNVAEARQRLESFRLDAVSITSDRITAERELRRALGLPAADNRCIVPVSVPVEAKIDPNWDACLAVMKEKQPDILQARERLTTKETEKPRPAAASEVVASTFLPDLGSQATTFRSDASAERAATHYSLFREALLQATRTLARNFFEIDANYKNYQSAKKFTELAAQRLKVQRAYYEEGRITIDRYLDTTGQYAQAVAKEAQFKTTYNNSIVGLEEAKGTLLEYHNITMVKRSGAPNPKKPKLDPGSKTASFEPPAPVRVESLQRAAPTPMTKEVKAGGSESPASSADLVSRTISFQMSINAGSKPVEIRGSITIGPGRPNDHGTTP